MSELLELCALFAFIYLLDCGVVVPRRALGLVRFAGRWRSLRAFSPNAAWSQGALLGNPLPPLSPPFVVEALPLALGPGGLIVPGDPPRFIPWSDLGACAAEGPRVVTQAGTVAALATRRGAAALAALLSRLQALDPAARAQQLERWLDQRFDVEGVRPRLALFRRETRLLAVVTNLLWLALVVGLAALVRLPLVVILVPALAVIGLGWIAAPVLTEWALRHSAWLRPEWRPEATKRALVALTPIGAIRSQDLLARELFGDLDPLAVAAALLPAPAFAALARPRLVEVHFGSLAAPAAAAADGRWWQVALRARIERLLGSRGVDQAALLAAPVRDGQQAVAWCPSCLTQYDRTRAQGGCPNPGCAGVSLVPYVG